MPVARRNQPWLFPQKKKSPLSSNVTLHLYSHSKLLLRRDFLPASMQIFYLIGVFVMDLVATCRYFGHKYRKMSEKIVIILKLLLVYY